MHKLPKGYGGVSEALNKRRAALRRSIASAAPGKDKASLRRQLRELQKKDFLERANTAELAALEREALELAEERLKRKGEKKEDGEPVEKDNDDDEDEDDMVVEWEDKYPTNNSDHGDDDDNSGGPSAGPVAQVTALTETTLPIR